jgi:hypothetical protein
VYCISHLLRWRRAGRRHDRRVRAGRDADVTKEHGGQLAPQLLVGERAAAHPGLLDQDVLLHQRERRLNAEVDGQRRIGMAHLGPSRQQQGADAVFDAAAEAQAALANHRVLDGADQERHMWRRRGWC